MTAEMNAVRKITNSHVLGMDGCPGRDITLPLLLLLLLLPLATRVDDWINDGDNQPLNPRGGMDGCQTLQNNGKDWENTLETRGEGKSDLIHPTTHGPVVLETGIPSCHASQEDSVHVSNSGESEMKAKISDERKKKKKRKRRRAIRA